MGISAADMQGHMSAPSDPGLDLIKTILDKPDEFKRRIKETVFVRKPTNDTERHNKFRD